MPRFQARDNGPSPPFRGEREGPGAERREGEVDDAANRLGGPPHPALSVAGGVEEKSSARERPFSSNSMPAKNAHVGARRRRWPRRERRMASAARMSVVIAIRKALTAAIVGST